MKNLKRIILLAIIIMSSINCATDEQKNEVVVNHATLVSNNYQAAYQDAVSLKKAIEKFTTNPSETTFKAAKDGWLKARESYSVTEVFRFQDGPIDKIGNENGPEALLNAWPMDESYVDYVKGNPTTGIINDSSKDINKTTLMEANEASGEENISIGYHAIEFLLWGQDSTAPDVKQAGNRPYTDFVDGGTAANQDRRRAYLKVCADLLIDHLQLLTNQWKDNGDYRKKFIAFDANYAIDKMITGMSTLAKEELAGERIYVAYDHKNQEDEQSCFSDNTHQDTRLNLQGIKNVYFSLIDGQENHSIHKLVQSKNKALAKEITDAFESAEQAVEATAIPFDFAITADNERPKVLKAVKALTNLGDKLAEVGTSLKLKSTAKLP